MLIPHDGRFIAAQVAKGLDLAVFAGLWDKAPDIGMVGSPLFRVHFAYPTVRRHGWKAIGVQPLANGLEQPASYSHCSVGSECFRVTDGIDDQPISPNEAAKLEPMAAWSHEHIVRRFEDPSYLG